MTTLKDFQLPSFTGFYNSIWLSDYDDERFRQDCDERGITLVDQWNLNFTKFKNAVGEAYAGHISWLMERDLHLSGFKLIFSEVVSPREYNFSTDRIFCTLEVKNLSSFLGSIVQLITPVKDNLAKMIYDNHTSCSGFVSFMDNGLDEWIARLSQDAEDNVIYLSYLVYYLIILHGGFNSSYSIDDEAYEFISGNGCDAYEFYEPSTDAAQEEYDRICLKEEERRWDEQHQLKIPFPNE